MDKDIYAVFGCGGFGREVMPLLHDLLSDSLLDLSSETVFVTDVDEDQVSEVNNIKVISFDDFCQMNAKNKYLTIAVADSRARRNIAQKVYTAGINLLTLRARNSVELSHVELGEGSIICPFVTLTSNISIGKCFQANIYSYVGHDCIIGDFVTFAPAVKCNGNVVIEDDVYVGTGAIIKQGSKGKPIVIGRGAKIAAGSFVTKSVPAGQTVIGNPAVPLTKDSLRRGKNG